MKNNKQVVVVITRGVVWFRNWVRENNNPNCKFIHVKCYNDVLGLIPNTIVKLEDWYLINDADKVDEYLKLKLKVLKPVKQKFNYVGWLLLPFLFPVWLFWKRSDRKSWNEFKTDLIYLK